MVVQDIINLLDTIFPPSLAEPWDNVGLLCGDKNAVVKKVLLALDVTTSVINEALLHKVDLIITHHPILFNPIAKVTNESVDGKFIATLLENKINLFVAHTNLDMYSEGLNNMIAKKLNLSDVKTMIPHESITHVGIGKIGVLPFDVPIVLESLAEYVKIALGAKFVRITGSPNTDVNSVAIITGSGTDYIDEAVKQKIDVMITGDVKYHTAIEANERGLCIIDAGHYFTEIMVIDLFKQILMPVSKKVKIIESNQQDIFTFV